MSWQPIPNNIATWQDDEYFRQYTVARQPYLEVQDGGCYADMEVLYTKVSDNLTPLRCIGLCFAGHYKVKF